MTRRIALAIGALAMALASCGGGTSATTVTVNQGSVVFGQGEVPPAIPTDFPIPPGATIGSYLIDRTNHRSEVNLVVQLNNQSAIRYYQVGLVEAGYVVDSSTGSGNAWNITYSRGELEGRVVITPQGQFSQIAISLNQA